MLTLKLHARVFREREKNIWKVVKYRTSVSNKKKAGAPLWTCAYTWRPGKNLNINTISRQNCTSQRVATSFFAQ